MGIWSTNRFSKQELFCNLFQTCRNLFLFLVFNSASWYNQSTIHSVFLEYSRTKIVSDMKKKSWAFCCTIKMIGRLLLIHTRSESSAEFIEVKYVIWTSKYRNINSTSMELYYLDYFLNLYSALNQWLLSCGSVVKVKFISLELFHK